MSTRQHVTAPRLLVSQLKDLPPTITVEEGRALVGAGRTAFYEGIRTGQWPHVRVGNRIRILTVPLLKQLGYDL